MRPSLPPVQLVGDARAIPDAATIHEEVERQADEQARAPAREKSLALGAWELAKVRKKIADQKRVIARAKRLAEEADKPKPRKSHRRG